jgi:ubiquinone/menaquinone biosynthesis C-methylase UbiE
VSGASEIKSCCAAAYQSDFVRLLLGDSFHPGGLQLTRRLGELLELSPRDRVLDVASGRGESAIFVARHFGCRVTGVDFGAGNVAEAAARAEAAGVAGLVTFEQGDAERLHYAEASFDAVLCECAFCTFPDKRAAAGEFARVLRSEGRLGLSDITRSDNLPPELDGLLARISCIGDARPGREYVAYLEAAGFGSVTLESHDDALGRLVHELQGRLLGAELMTRLEKLILPGVDFTEAKAMGKSAAAAVKAGLLGYALLTARKTHAADRA